MKNHLLLVLAAILFWASPVNSSGRLSKQCIISQGKKHSYYLFVPDKINPPVPLLITLHGLGRDGLSLVEKWEGLASKEGIILAGPDVWGSPTWTLSGNGPEFLHDLAEELKAKYPVDPRRVYLFGHSMGAVFALTMSMLESKYFAATAIHAGAWENSQYSFIDDAKRKIPIAILVGDQDQYFSTQVVKLTAERLKQRGFPVELTIMMGPRPLVL